MTAPTTIYSERLGPISDDQLDAAASRLGLGRFVSAVATSGGLFGQNLFLNTTEGEFVLRGAPHWVNGKRHDQWQFRKERFFAELLHEQTTVPIPWPQLFDDRSDIFGWPYLVMPKLAGTNFSDRSLLETLSREDHLSIADAFGGMLRQFSALQWPEAGEVDETCEFAPYPNGYTQHLASEIRLMAKEAEGHGSLSPVDRAWIDNVIVGAASADAAEPATYVHGDFTFGNVMLERLPEWRLSGVFDLHTSCFGSWLFDLCRQGCIYLDRDKELARRFLHAAIDRSPDPDHLLLCLCNERMKIWEYFTHPAHRAEWTRVTTFREFAGRYAKPFLDTLGITN